MKQQLLSPPVKVVGQTKGFGLQGRFVCKIVEHPMLEKLRRIAARRAGVYRENFDGSAADISRLPKPLRDAVDQELSPLVSRFSEVLSSQKYSRVIEETPESKNLFLDQGVNTHFTSSIGAFGSLIRHCAVGTGTTPTVTDSGTTTATSAGSTVTASGGSFVFTSGMNGMKIKFDSGEERYITYVSPTTATTDTPLTVGVPTLFAVHAVNQTGLASETKRTSTLLTGTGNTGHSDAGSVRTFKITHDFSVEVANQNYTELGWSYSSSAGSNLAARALVTGGTVTVLIGQQLRTVYSLAITVGPTVSTPGNYAITGWPVAPATTTDGDFIVNGLAVIGTLDTAGTPNSGVLDNWSQTQLTAVLSTTSVLPLFGNPVPLGTQANSNSGSKTAYAANSFTRTWESTFDLNTANRSDWRMLYWVNQSATMAFLFDEAQTKDNTFTLTVRITETISRTLTNP